MRTDYLSRRVGPVFAAEAARAMAQEAAQNARSEAFAARGYQPLGKAVEAPAKAYKPAHGGYPGEVL